MEIYTYDDYENDDILDYMSIPLDYYDEQEPCIYHPETYFDSAEEF